MYSTSVLMSSLLKVSSLKYLSWVGNVYQSKGTNFASKLHLFIKLYFIYYMKILKLEIISACWFHISLLAKENVRLPYDIARNINK